MPIYLRLKMPRLSVEVLGMYVTMLGLLHHLIPHPAAAFAGAGAIHSWRWEGFHLWGRTKQGMISTDLVQSRPITGRMIRRAMRNLVIAFILFLLIGNLTIFVMFKLASTTSAARPLPDLPGIENLTEVNGNLWRGSSPTRAGYSALAAHGVTKIVDLRAEDLFVDVNYINSLGIELVRIPQRDGQAPTPAMVNRFLAEMNSSKGLVYLHCGAGVGRAGTMAASYLVQSGETSAFGAVVRNLAVGPPSLEQIAYAASLDEGEVTKANPVLTAISRVLDAPRRTLVRVRNSYGH